MATYSVLKASEGPTVITQSTGFLDQPQDTTVNTALLSKQVYRSRPNPPTLLQQTGMLSPDRSTTSRLNNFDPELFDMSDTSHLTRLMRVLLGDSGTGALRKRYTVARLAATIQGSNFYDLDEFYGSLFSMTRKPEEVLPVNPMISVANPDQWDDIDTSDAYYRERIIRLAQSLPMAGTLEGLKMAAEAVSGVECDLIETWKMIAAGYTPFTGRTWFQIAADQQPNFLATFPTWSSTIGQTWQSMIGTTQIGLTGTSSPDEVIIVPKRDYAAYGVGQTDPSRAIALAKQWDVKNIMQVLEKIKPAGVLVSVSTDGIKTDQDVQIASLYADSENWQIISRVNPSPSVTAGGSSPYATSDVPTSSSGGSTSSNNTAVVSINSDITYGTVQPSPPMSQVMQTEVFYNSDVTVCNAYEMSPDFDLGSGGGGIVVNKSDWQTVPQNSAQPVAYKPAWALKDSRTLVAAQATKDSFMQAHPYSSAREVVPTHG